MIMHETRFYYVIYLPDKVWDHVVPHKLEFDIYRFKAKRSLRVKSLNEKLETKF